MDKLKPCPFCGGEGEIVFYDGEVYVRCGGCCMHTDHMYVPNIRGRYRVSKLMEMSIDAAARWNRRAGKQKRGNET